MSTGASSTLRARGHPPAVGATPVEGKLPGGSSAVLWEVAWDQRPECERVSAVIGRHRGTWGGAGLAQDGAR